MGFLDKVKGWLNIGGVKCKLQGVNTVIPRSGNQIKGQVVLTSKGDKEVKKLVYKFLLRKTTGRGDQKETKDFVIAESRHEEPFTIKEGETRTMDFTLNYSLEKSLKDMGGFLGAVGKVGSFVSGEKLEYFVTAVCDVKGTALDPGDKVAVTIAD